MICYMPTIALAITVAYNALKNDGKDVVIDYPPIRVWGTIGFIVALWTVSLLHLETSSGQFYVASAASLLLGAVCIHPADAARRNSASAHSKPLAGRRARPDVVRACSATASWQCSCFFAMLLGAALQLTNAYGDTFLHDFAKIDAYKDLDRGALSGDHHVDLADFRDAVHPGDSVLPAPLRHQDGHGHQHARLVLALRPVRLRRSRRRDCG